MKRYLISAIVVTRNRKVDLIRCLDSLKASSYKMFEIIVVDNGSSPSVKTWFPKKYPRIKLITNRENLGAAKGRNQGIFVSKGKFILFIDDDAVVDERMIQELIRVLRSERRVGIVQPKIYDMEKRNILQGIGCDVNLLTGRVSALGIREKDNGQYEKIIELQSIGCIWMIKREIIDKIGGYDEVYFIPWEDTDFSFRAREAGFKILFAPKALAWHRGPKSTFVNPLIDYLGIRSPERAYRVVRNKIIFMKKHAKAFNFLLFLFIFLPLYAIVHSLIIIISFRLDLLLQYWKGLISGVLFVLSDAISHLKIFLLSFQEPVCWIIEKSAQSILDIGCGQGFPMQMIKMRMDIGKSVGVDLFKPYIEMGGKLKIHDQYVISDVRKLKFKDKSFDVVMALQVLEHLYKEDAWKVLEKLEKIAKKQIIVSSPIGRMYHPMEDNNKLQLHLSYFYPEEFENRGYKILKFGRREILGEGGLVHKVKNIFLRRLIYLLNFLITPLYYFYQPVSNYHFYAYKKIEN